MSVYNSLKIVDAEFFRIKHKLVENSPGILDIFADKARAFLERVSPIFLKADNTFDFVPPEARDSLLGSAEAVARATLGNLGALGSSVSVTDGVLTSRGFAALFSKYGL